MRKMFANRIGGPSFHQNIRQANSAQNVKKTSAQPGQLNTKQNIDSDKMSTMATIKQQEHINSSSQQVFDRIKNTTDKMSGSLKLLGKLANNKNSNKISPDTLNSSLLSPAKNVYKDSNSIAVLHNVTPATPDLKASGLKSVVSYISSAQKNFNQASLAMTHNKDTSMSELMNLSTKMNQANSKIYVIVTVARQLVDGVNKLGNAQI
ncbi:MAG: hypothetical protein KAH32_01530 [Chlamydiia bacterium]|nr:hypothetical protein [Chlamydiia bacterium]